MDEQDRVIEVRTPGQRSVKDVVTAAALIGASFALIFLEGRPRAVISTSDLDEADDETPIADVAREVPELEPHDVKLELSEDKVADVHALVQDDELAVLDDGRSRLVLPLRGKSLEHALQSGMLAFAAQDIELPGNDPELPDHEITYRCVAGHYTPQSIDNPNRECPRCGLRMFPLA